MKIVKKSLAVSALAAVSLVSACPPALAVEKIAQLPDPEDVRLVTLAFYGLHIDTYVPVTEEQLFRNGCIYVTDPGSDKNLALLNILREGVTLSEKGPHRFRLRNAIILQLKDDSVLRLLISDAGNRTPGVFGTADNEMHDAQGFLLSNEAMLKTIRVWAMENLKPQQSNDHCY